MKLRLIATAVLSLACSAAVAQPLNPQQKQQVLETFQSMALATASVQSMNPNTTPGQVGSDSLSQLFLKMSGILKSACKATATPPTNQSPSDKIYTLNGANCAVNYSEENKDDGQGHSVSTNEYAVLDAGYKSLNDVDGVSQTVTINVTPHNDGTFAFNIGGTGSMHSKKWGAIPLTMKGTGVMSATGEGEVSVIMSGTAGNLAVELKVVSKSTQQSSTTTYFLNDAQLTDQEVSTYLDLPFTPVENLTNQLMAKFGIR